MELRNFIEPNLDLERLAKYLDELGHPGRVWATRQWDRKLQAHLYEAAKGFHPLTLEHFVPASVGPLVEVIHDGKNTLPLHTLFQKRFCRPTDPTVEGKLWGYNEQSLGGVTGPGFFVTHAAEAEGEIDIDYTMLPTEKPESWPAIIPNSARLGRFVYYNMIDVMRGISNHVSIGRAKRGGKWMDAWFVLVREDPG